MSQTLSRTDMSPADIKVWAMNIWSLNLVFMWNRLSGWHVKYTMRLTWKLALNTFFHKKTKTKFKAFIHKGWILFPQFTTAIVKKLGHCVKCIFFYFKKSKFLRLNICYWRYCVLFLFLESRLAYSGPTAAKEQTFYIFFKVIILP